MNGNTHAEPGQDLREPVPPGAARVHAHVFSDSSLYLAVEALDLAVRVCVARRGLANDNAGPLAHRSECPFEFLTSVYADPPRLIVLR